MSRTLLVACWFALPLYLAGQTKNDLSPTGSPAKPRFSKIDLLDDSLSHWYAWLGVPHYTVKGLPAGTPTGDGLHGIPLGRHDLTGVFSMTTLAGEPVLKISGEIYGGLTTKLAYENYHLRLDYKWGEKNWEPRKLPTRGSGILFHLTGTNEDAYWSAFMMGLEYQIAEGTTGDLLFMTNRDSTLIPAVTGRVGPNRTWRANAPLTRIGATKADLKFHRSQTYESAGDDWTTVDLYTWGSSGVYLVNGHVVMAFQNAGVQQAGKPITPLTGGKIQIQSEGSELYCKNITIDPIDDLPVAIRKQAGLN